MKAEFGAGFTITQTRRYVICSDAGKHYDRWVGMLFERLMTAFFKQWKTKELKLHKPHFPLVAVVLADRRKFAAYAARDAGVLTAGTAGYYSMRSNRIVLYDLTASPGSGPARSMTEVPAQGG